MSARERLREAWLEAERGAHGSPCAELRAAVRAFLDEPTGLDEVDAERLARWRMHPEIIDSRDAVDIIDRLGAAPALTKEQRETVEYFRRFYADYDQDTWPKRLLAEVVDLHFPPPEPAVKKGDRVRWWRLCDEGTGTYIDPPEVGRWPHWVEIANSTVQFCVERVEPLGDRRAGGEA